jgi:MoaA/NifB/PqqE/SkfB family radical SAM enzyme
MIKDPLYLYDLPEYIKADASNICNYPRMLILQVSSYCNFSCRMCQRRNKVSRRQITGLGEGFMSLELIEKLIEESKEYKSFLGFLFAIFGEPLMHPDILEIVRMIKKAGLKVQITTNASLLDKELSTNLIEAGLDKIKISFQGTTPEEYAFWRNKPLFDVIKNNTIRLLEIRNKLHSSCYIQVGTSVANDTKEDIDKFVSYWKERADDVYWEYTGLLHVRHFPDIKNLKTKYEAQKMVAPCRSFLVRLPVWWNGKVSRCSDDEEEWIGDANTESIYDIWNSDRLNKDRETCKRLGNIWPACKFCYTNIRVSKY